MTIPLKSLSLLAILLILSAIALGLMSLAVGSLPLPQAPPVPKVLPRIPERLADKPLTPHAQLDHAGDKYNATNLPEMWDNGTCNRRKAAYCPGSGTLKVVCEIHDGLDAGIVYSLTTNRIVTAFAGPPTYWDKVCGKCNTYTTALGGIMVKSIVTWLRIIFAVIDWVWTPMSNVTRTSYMSYNESRIIFKRR